VAAEVAVKRFPRSFSDDDEAVFGTWLSRREASRP